MPTARSETASATLVVEVYLPSTIVRGELITNQNRLSDYFLLRSGDELFSLKNAEVVDAGGQPSPFGERHYFVQTQEVLFIIDRSAATVTPSTNLDHSRIAKVAKKALMLIGPYWVRGDVHTMPGGGIQDLLALKGRFIPVTDATLVGHERFGPATLLVNRTKIACIAAVE